MTARRRLVRNTVALATAEGVGRGLTLLTLLIVARLLGPARLGEVALAQAVALYLAQLGDGGLSMLTYRQIALTPERLPELVVNTTIVQAGLALIVAGAIALVSVIAPFPSGTSHLLLILTPYAAAQAFNLQYALQALERMRTLAAVKILTQAATAGATIWLVAATRDPVWVAVCLWGGQFGGDIAMMAILRRRYRFRVRLPARSSVVGLLRAGLPLLGSIALYNYIGVIDLVVLGALRTPGEVGEYTAPMRMVSAACALSTVPLYAVLAEMVRRYSTNLEAFASFMDRLIRLTTRLTLAATLLVVFEAEAIVRLLYGSEYSGSVALLRILVLIVPLWWYGACVENMLIAGGEQRAFFRGWAITAAVATVAFPVGIALFGPTGAAGAGVIVGVVRATSMTALVQRRLRVMPAVAAARELRYIVGPAVALGITVALASRRLFPDSSVAPIAVWLVALAASEAIAGLPTVRAVGGLGLRGGLKSP